MHSYCSHCVPKMFLPRWIFFVTKFSCFSLHFYFLFTMLFYIRILARPLSNKSLWISIHTKNWILRNPPRCTMRFLCVAEKMNNTRSNRVVMLWYHHKRNCLWLDFKVILMIDDDWDTDCSWIRDFPILFHRACSHARHATSVRKIMTVKYCPLYRSLSHFKKVLYAVTRYVYFEKW